ncbi:MAG TPA: hypothetical protein VIS74_03435 [Chthoniobacterales bacterium]
MKTTLELPDDLYQAAKTRAASQKKKVKDLISEGLRAVLTAEPEAASDQEEARRVLAALDEILRCPPSAPGRTALLQAEVRRLRSEGWNREEAGS